MVSAIIYENDRRLFTQVARLVCINKINGWIIEAPTKIIPTARATGPRSLAYSVVVDLKITVIETPGADLKYRLRTEILRLSPYCRIVWQQCVLTRVDHLVREIKHLLPVLLVHVNFSKH